jgi:methionine-rich copper-binding protein CopC
MVNNTESPALIVIEAGENVNPEFTIVQVVEKPSTDNNNNALKSKDFVFIVICLVCDWQLKTRQIFFT